MKRAVIFCILIFLGNLSCAMPLKLAILDNPEIETGNVSNPHSDAYEEGVKAAVYRAKQQDVEIEYKTFFYSENLIDIVYQVPRVTQWNPDAIVGLRNSNQLLMSKVFFKKELILSILATDKEIENLPSNFHSLGSPDKENAEGMVKFLHKYYPKKNIFILVQTDSRESFNLADLFRKKYKKLYPQIKMRQGDFLKDDPKKLDMKKLLKKYQNGDVIVLLTILYHGEIDLIKEIAAYLSPEKLVFITSADNLADLSSMKNDDPSYEIFHITSLFPDKNTKDYQKFVEDYQRVNHSEPTKVMSYVVYQAVMSIVTALKEFPAPKSLSEKKAILYSYHAALKKNPKWFRERSENVYKIEKNGEVFMETLK